MESETVDEWAEYPQYNGLSIAEIVQRFEKGDRLHVELTRREGRIRWRKAWVTDAGEDYVEFDNYRIEITDPEAAGRGAVTLFEDLGGEWVSEQWTEGLNGLERVPAEAFDDQEWYEWEIVASETMGGGVSTDQTVFPEAPTREAAEEKAKRWGEKTYTPIVYQEREVTRE